MYFVLISINGNHHKPTFILDDYYSNRAIQWNVQRTQHKFTYIHIPIPCGVQRVYVCEFWRMRRAIKACKNMFLQNVDFKYWAFVSHIWFHKCEEREKEVDSNERNNRQKKNTFQLQYYFDSIKYGNFRSQMAVTQSLLQPD